ncbi:MAG: ribose-phosphate pyrophosphokinase [Nanoarchaeota archaeon]|nr:ribose-phosphate pyrophosphokinase [Nanoarchaeota archaeon]
MSDKISILAGTANLELAKEISSHLKIPLTPVEVKHFNDGEIYTHIEKSVRGSTVFLIQPTSPPVNDKLIEFLLITDALRRASAKEINAVIPYYGYSRQDRKNMPREPISAKLVANLIETAGADRVITFDLHVDQIQGFFNIPVDNLETVSLIANYLLDKNLEDVVVVSPDVGGARRARKLANILGTDIAVIDKRRPKHGVAEIMNVIGKVKEKNAILVDDMIDTAGTITTAAKALKKKGAKDIYICATHALLSSSAVEKLKDDSIKEVIVTNTIDIPEEKKFDKLKIISLSKLLADSITKIHQGTPMGLLFDNLYKRAESKRK